jgi:hypothetical protein
MVWDQKNAVLRRPTKLQLAQVQITPYSSGVGLLTGVLAQGRIPIKAVPWPINKVVQPVVGFTCPGNGTRVNIAKAQTLKFWVEVMAGSSLVSIPITWTGSETKIVNPGDELALSDDWCLLNGAIPAGASWWMRWEASVATAGSGGFLFSALQQSGGTGSQFAQATWWYNAGVPSQDNMAGTGPLVGTGSSGNTSGAPNTIHSVLVAYDYQRTSALLLGDSKFVGSGTPNARGNPDGGASHISNALAQMNIPYINYGFAGTTMQGWSQVSAAAWAMAAYVTDVVIGYPINDINTGSPTLANLQSWFNTLVAKLLSINPTLRIWVVQCEPGTNTKQYAVTQATSSGTVATLSMADTSGLTVGGKLSVTGATPIAYNVTAATITEIVPNVSVSYNFAGGTSPATGTVVATDAWSTTANQTPRAGCEYPTSTLVSYKAWITSLKSLGTIFGILDPNVVVEAGGSGQSGKWTIGSTGDGIHELEWSYIACVYAFKSQYLAQGGIPNTGVF